MAYKKKVLDPFPEILTGMFKNWGFTFIPEKGKILDAHTVQAGEQKISAEYIVIAQVSAMHGLILKEKNF